MKALSLCVITFLSILKVFANDFGDLYDVPDSVMSDVLKLDKAPNIDLVGDTLFSVDINKYMLFTSNNPTEGQPLVYNDEESIKKSNFDIHKNTIFSLHGWRGDYDNPLNRNITKAVFDSADASNWNLIRVDWSKYAKLNYVSASAAIPKVGEYVCRFIKFLTTLGVLLSQIVLIGQSLGAHVVGYAGRICDSKISMIFGMDPGRPIWELHPGKLSEKDGCYVSVTHTSDLYGDPSRMGHADFYPNGGKHMPNCGYPDLSCNHDMAARYWCASWYYPQEFVANQCGSMDDVKHNTCNGIAVPFGGYNMSNKPQGLYRINFEDKDFPFVKIG